VREIAHACVNQPHRLVFVHCVPRVAHRVLVVTWWRRLGDTSGTPGSHKTPGQGWFPLRCIVLCDLAVLGRESQVEPVIPPTGHCPLAAPKPPLGPQGAHANVPAGRRDIRLSTASSPVALRPRTMSHRQTARDLPDLRFVETLVGTLQGPGLQIRTPAT